MFPEAVRNLCKQRDAGFKRRKLASMSLRLVTLSSFLLGILLMSGGHGALCWLNSTRDYAYMRRVTKNNYSHFLRDVIWRSVLRDWPTRPVRLERWITDRDPTFFLRSNKVASFSLSWLLNLQSCLNGILARTSAGCEVCDNTSHVDSFRQGSLLP